MSPRAELVASQRRDALRAESRPLPVSEVERVDVVVAGLGRLVVAADHNHGVAQHLRRGGRGGLGSVPHGRLPDPPAVEVVEHFRGVIGDGADGVVGDFGICGN